MLNSDKIQQYLNGYSQYTRSDNELDSFLTHFTSSAKTKDTGTREDELDPLSLFNVQFIFNPEKSNVATALLELESIRLDRNSSKTAASIDMSKYVQNVEIPRMTIPDGPASENYLIGKYPTNGTYLTPDNNNLILDIVNTCNSLIDGIFYPWSREVVANKWLYDEQPYTTATIVVDHSLHSNVKYNFFGCRPQQLEMLKATQNQTGQNLIRQVTFKYDIMTVTKDSALDNIESNWENSAVYIEAGNR